MDLSPTHQQLQTLSPRHQTGRNKYYQVKQAASLRRVSNQQSPDRMTPINKFGKEMRSASNVVLNSSGAAREIELITAQKMPKVKRMGPDFAERSAKVVSKYSYNLPKKSITATKPVAAKRQNGTASSILMENQKVYMKSLRNEPITSTLDLSKQAPNSVHQSPFISKIAGGSKQTSFGNDRAPFFSQYDREQATRDERPRTLVESGANQLMRVNYNQHAYKLKTVVQRPGNYQNHPALMQQQKRTLNNKSSIVGPTIKASSSLASYLPEISQRVGEIADEGENEPFLRSVSKAMADGDTREIDGIQFWSHSDTAKANEIASRRFSLSMIEKKSKDGRDTNMTVNSGKTQAFSINKRETLREKQEKRTSKQELCNKLDSLERNKSVSPSRISRLYAMLQSTDKGANMLGSSSKRQHHYFQENIKLTQDQNSKIDQVNLELNRLSSKSALNYKDSLSRLSEAIDIFKSQKHLPEISEDGPPAQKHLNSHDSEVQLQIQEVVIPEDTERGDLKILDDEHQSNVDKPQGTPLRQGSKWNRMPSARSIVIQEKNIHPVHIAFNLEEYRSKQTSQNEQSEQNPSTADPDTPHITFHDNIDVEDFVRLSSTIQYKFKIDMRQFDPVCAMKLPYVFEGPNLRKYSPSESSQHGFWSKLLLQGSGQPIARENSTLMPKIESGQLVLYLFGGSPMITGQFHFEIYKINPMQNTWQKVPYERPIVQTLGSRPVWNMDQDTGNFEIFFFSGMVPLQRINSGVKVCPPDMQRFDSKGMRWSRIKSSSNNQLPIVGRKNFAMSHCEDLIFVTGGMDNGQNLLSEFLMHNPNNGSWQDLRQTRRKEKQSHQQDAGENDGSKAVSNTASMNDLTQLTQTSPKASNDNMLTYQPTETTLPPYAPQGILRHVSPQPNQQTNELGHMLGKRRKLLKRSHHTVCTLKGKTDKLRNGYKMDYYHSFVFGGLIQEVDGRFCPTNDLIEVVSKNVVLDKSQLTEVENPIKPSLAITNADEVQVTLLTNQGGVRPLPRRDHQALLITNNKYLLIYGGKNDNAFSYRAPDLGILNADTPRIQSTIYNEIKSTSLDDIMLFNLEQRVWTAVSQRGWRPEARWASAICYHEQMQQLFIFGGTGANGSCRNDVYCLEMNPNRSNYKYTELQNHMRDIDAASKRMKGLIVPGPEQGDR